MKSFDIVIVGAGPGGVAAATQASLRGLSVAIINSSHMLGYGLHGAYKSKGMWELAKDANVARKVGRGYSPCPTDVINFAEVRSQLQAGTEELSSMYLEQLARLGISFIPGFARLVDPHTVEVDQQRFCAKWIILATGTQPRLLPGITIDDDFVLTSDEIVDLPRSIRSIAILGAGVIGCEFASIFAAFGLEVTLIDTQPRILASEDPDISAFLEGVFRRSGINLRQERRMSSMRREGEGVVTTLDDGSSVESEAVLVAIGRKPNVKGLGLETVGVGTDSDGYIKVDRQMRTSVPHIYAVGDVGRRPDADDICLVHVAEAEGRQAVRSILGEERGLGYAHVPFIIFTHPPIAGVGDHEGAARARFPEPRVVRFSNARNHRLHAMRSYEGFVKLIVAPEGDDRILGVRAVGPQADSLIGEVSVLIEHQIPYTALLHSYHAHPSLSESLQNAARVVAGLMAT